MPCPLNLRRHSIFAVETVKARTPSRRRGAPAWQGVYYCSMNVFRAILFIGFVLAPCLYAQSLSEAVSLPEGITATGDTTEVRVLNGWAEAHVRTDPVQARQVAERALTLAQSLNDQRGIGHSAMLLGSLASQIHEMEVYYTAAREAFERGGDEHGLVRSQNGLGSVYMFRGEHERALSTYLQVLQDFERLGDTRRQVGVLSNVGTLHTNQGNLEEALIYFERAIRLGETLNDPALLIPYLDNFGVVLADHGSYEEAEPILLRALAIAQEYGDVQSEATISNNLGFLFNKQGLHEQALPFLLSAEQLASEQGDNWVLAAAYNELAKTHLGLGRYDLARRYGHESLALIQQIGSVSDRMEVLLTLSRIYEAAGNDRQAFAYHREYSGLRDSLFTAERSEIIADMQVRYETEERQRVIERLEQHTQIQRLRQIVLLGGILVALLAAGLFYYRYRAKRKANRLLEELDVLKSRFFANVSHEFRTPLTLLLGPLQDQVNGLSPSKETAHAMLRNAQRLERLVDQLLELERIDAGQLKLHKSTIDLRALVRERVDMFHTLAQQKQVRLERETPSTPVLVYADAEHLARVVDNLLSNAIKFTPAEGRVRVELRASPVELVVEDTGPGIPDEWRERVFDRFAQMGDQATRDSEGAGLGLALSREIVQLHQGELFVQEVATGGACFVLTLPSVREEIPAKHGVVSTPVAKKDTFRLKPLPLEENGQSEDKAAEISSTKSRVLVVEDQNDLRQYIASILVNDYAVETARNGEEALSAVRREPPDVIVSDIVMPRRDGFALARALRSEPEYAGIPLIFLTARTGDRDKIEALAIGADQYLKKPFQRDVLLAHVAAALQTCRRLREHLGRLFPQQTDAESDTFVERARFWIEENIHQEDLSVEDMAAGLHMSRTTLFRRLVAEAGLPPSEFIRTTRLARARRLLETSAGNVSEVAYAVGFGSLAAFSRAYRIHFGIPPSADLGQAESTIETSG